MRKTAEANTSRLMDSPPEPKAPYPKPSLDAVEGLAIMRGTTFFAATRRGNLTPPSAPQVGQSGFQPRWQASRHCQCRPNGKGVGCQYWAGADDPARPLGVRQWSGFQPRRQASAAPPPVPTTQQRCGMPLPGRVDDPARPRGGGVRSVFQPSRQAPRHRQQRRDGSGLCIRYS